MLPARRIDSTMKNSIKPLILKGGRISAALLAVLFYFTVNSVADESKLMNDLPLAGERHFDTLDEYLAYRAELGKHDRPYYLEVEPDLFQLIIGRGTLTRPPHYFTRAQLLEEFGFTR